VKRFTYKQEANITPYRRQDPMIVGSLRYFHGRN
jgi:hypothetical protein